MDWYVRLSTSPLPSPAPVALTLIRAIIQKA